MLDGPTIADACLAGLVGHAALLDAEHSAYGLDAMPEVELHEPIATGLRGVGLGVLPEHPFPASAETPPETRESERERCDLVITERPGLAIFDGLQSSRELRDASSTLFAEAAEREAGELGPNEVTSDEAFWLEIKASAQTVYREGVPVANTRYTSELVTEPLKDLKKLARNEGITEGACLVVLFAQSEEVVEHDLSAGAHKMLDKGAALSTAVVRTSPMSDRVGNGALGVLLAGFKRQ